MEVRPSAQSKVRAGAVTEVSPSPPVSPMLLLCSRFICASWMRRRAACWRRSPPRDAAPPPSSPGRSPPPELRSRDAVGCVVAGRKPGEAGPPGTAARSDPDSSLPGRWCSSPCREGRHLPDAVASTVRCSGGEEVPWPMRRTSSSSPRAAVRSSRAADSRRRQWVVAPVRGRRSRGEEGGARLAPDAALARLLRALRRASQRSVSDAAREPGRSPLPRDSEGPSSWLQVGLPGEVGRRVSTRP